MKREDDYGGEEEEEDPEIRMDLHGALPPLHGPPGLAKRVRGGFSVLL